VSLSIVAVAKARGQFGNPGERERPPLEAAFRRLVKAVTGETIVCVTVIFKVQSRVVC
jgi:hypothetical protein